MLDVAILNGLISVKEMKSLPQVAKLLVINYISKAKRLLFISFLTQVNSIKCSFCLTTIFLTLTFILLSLSTFLFAFLRIISIYLSKLLSNTSI
jgi:hypothetical protein